MQTSAPKPALETDFGRYAIIKLVPAAGLFMRHSLQLALIGLAACGLLTVPAYPLAAAQVYKWVDSKGRTHFGDKPPESDTSVTRIETPQSSSSAMAPDAGERRRKQQKLLNAFSSERKEREDKRRKERQEKIVLKRKCAATRHNLALLQRANLLYRKDKDGNRQYTSDTQRSQLIERLKTSLRTHCKSG